MSRNYRLFSGMPPVPRDVVEDIGGLYFDMGKYLDPDEDKAFPFFQLNYEMTRKDPIK